MINHAKERTMSADARETRAPGRAYLAAEVARILEHLQLEPLQWPPPVDEPPAEPPPVVRWQDRPDLLPDVGQTVLGVYDGNGEDINEVASLLGRMPGLTTLYWEHLHSPETARLERELDGQRIVRVDLELTTAFTNPASKGGLGLPKAGLWAAIASGEFDQILRPILAGIGRLCSLLHEFDLSSEQGGGGTDKEFVQMWQHVVTIGREVSPETKWFWNPSGGFGGDVSDRWNALFPGVEFVDFVGWDPFDWLNVPTHNPPSSRRESFDGIMRKFGRWDWYKRTFGERGDPGWRPVMIGETACCEAAPPHQPADAWIDDMRAWLHEHPDVTHVIWFSVQYDQHDRRLTGGPQKRAGLERAGGDPLLV